MNKNLQGLSYKVYFTSLSKFRQVSHPYLFQANPPFYPSALLLCCDNIKCWSIPDQPWINMQANDSCLENGNTEFTVQYGTIFYVHCCQEFTEENEVFLIRKTYVNCKLTYRHKISNFLNENLAKEIEAKTRTNQTSVSGSFINGF